MKIQCSTYGLSQKFYDFNKEYYPIPDFVQTLTTLLAIIKNSKVLEPSFIDVFETGYRTRDGTIKFMSDSEFVIPEGEEVIQYTRRLSFYKTDKAAEIITIQFQFDKETGTLSCECFATRHELPEVRRTSLIAVNNVATALFDILCVEPDIGKVSIVLPPPTVA